MKVLSLDQSLQQIYSAPYQQGKAKLSLPTIWPKIQPFLMMLSMLVPGIAKYINALIAAIDTILAGAKALPPKLPALWKKVRPFVVMLSGLFGKKVAVYINAFVAAIDKLVETEDEE